MASTFFQDYNQNNPIVSAWLNDINGGVYSAKGVPRKAAASSAAWVRFSVVGGVVAIQQSSNVATVVRTAVGVYVVTYAAALINSANCYEICTGHVGFQVPFAEATTGVTVVCTDATSASIDPNLVCLVVHGAN